MLIDELQRHVLHVLHSEKHRNCYFVVQPPTFRQTRAMIFQRMVYVIWPSHHWGPQKMAKSHWIDSHHQERETTHGF